MKDTTQVGATYGLTRTNNDDHPEQVYVYADPDRPLRPIRIDGWKGYSVPNRMHLTRNQAEELRDLLTEALDRVPTTPDAYLVGAEVDLPPEIVESAKPMRLFRGKWMEIE